MLTRVRSFALALAAFVPSSIVAQAPATSSSAPALTPPVAAVRPHRFDEFGTVRIDQYYWLKDRNNPEVIKYLEDENAYTKAVMAHTEALQGRLYDELKGRVLQNDQSVPFREGNYFYYTRLVEGKNYPIYARKRGSVSAPEEIMIDANALAEGKATFLIRAWEVSSGEDLLAFAADTTGGRVSSIRFKNLRTGEMLSDVVPRAIGGIAWAEDNRTLFYTKPDSVSVRPYQVYRHRLGTPAATDQMVYQTRMRRTTSASPRPSPARTS
jgi:oligopeptidase B